MLEGKSARKLEELTGVPRSNLMRYYTKITEMKANAKKPIKDTDLLLKFHERIKNFRPPKSGKHHRYFLDDEEEMFVCTLEEAHDAAFPYDRNLLVHMAESTGKEVYGKDFTLGKNQTWVRCFERRWSERITKIKAGSIDRHRAKKATTEVRDGTWKNFELFCQKLVRLGRFTQAQMDNLGKHLCNADEVSSYIKTLTHVRTYAHICFC